MTRDSIKHRPEGYELKRMLAYQGKAGCESVVCTRYPGSPDCIGYHCPYCDEPCSSQGHRCPLLEEEG